MKSIIAILVLAFLSARAASQESAPLSVEPAVPRALLRENYRYQLKAHGGIMPYHWELDGGALPAGISLGRDGVLSGVPEESGEFHFAVTVTDSAKPAHQGQQDISTRVTAALLADWTRPPEVDGAKLHGSLKVANGGDDDLDLTVIVLAVNEVGKAFAAGYQHGPLRKDTTIEVPFDDTLPNGSYVVNVDVVGEIAPKKKIYRTRLATPKPMKVQVE